MWNFQCYFIKISNLCFFCFVFVFLFFCFLLLIQWWNEYIKYILNALFFEARYDYFTLFCWFIVSPDRDHYAHWLAVSASQFSLRLQLLQFKSLYGMLDCHYMKMYILKYFLLIRLFLWLQIWCRSYHFRYK